jgi:hypothetical protein
MHPAALPRKNVATFTNFAKTLGIATLALCAGLAVTAVFWAGLHAGAAAAGVVLMALNALAAVGVLKLPLRNDPAQRILISMLLRLVLVSAVMFCVIRLVEAGPALYSFVFSALGAYVVFQAVEVRHLMRNPEVFAK